MPDSSFETKGTLKKLLKLKQLIIEPVIVKLLVLISLMQKLFLTHTPQTLPPLAGAARARIQL